MGAEQSCAKYFNNKKIKMKNFKTFIQKQMLRVKSRKFNNLLIFFNLFYMHNYYYVVYIKILHTETSVAPDLNIFIAYIKYYLSSIRL